MIRVALPLLLLLTLTPVRAELGFDTLAEVTTSPETLQGSFTQVKYLASLDTELNSTGVFEYRRGESIRWRIEKPIENELIMTPERISSRQGDQELIRLELDNNPAAAVLGQVLFAVLMTEWQQLEHYFAVDGSIDDGQWQARLLPRETLANQVIHQVDLKGDALLREIVLQELSGDTTTIHLHDLRQ